MTLLIACILVYAFKLPWWCYLLAAAVWWADSWLAEIRTRRIIAALRGESNTP